MQECLPAAVRLRQRGNPAYQPSVEIPSASRSALGMAASMSLFSNLRYQAVSGIDRVLTERINFMWVYLLLSSTSRAASQCIGQPTRLYLQVGHTLKWCSISVSGASLRWPIVSRTMPAHECGQDAQQSTVMPPALFTALSFDLISQASHVGASQTDVCCPMQGLPTKVPDHKLLQRQRVRRAQLAAAEAHFAAVQREQAAAEAKRQRRAAAQGSSGFEMSTRRQRQPEPSMAFASASH